MGTVGRRGGASEAFVFVLFLFCCFDLSSLLLLFFVVPLSFLVLFRGSEASRHRGCGVRDGQEGPASLRAHPCLRDPGAYGLGAPCRAAQRPLHTRHSRRLRQCHEGVQKQLPLVFLRGSNIRFVHIPDNVDIMKLVEERRLMLDQAATAYTGKGAPAPKPQASVTTA
ncbi:uncharacterized protein [Physcomitrium patens]|uniref:uncharacterized protein isoform X1 n=1 Tax=Physcomitrium patens TaxID=3218 RepID=UPI000D16C2D2|nr:uncharacterized protein LOC112288690 isoform X1 [Physcomitrium patens]|eukprot:XP_024388929.1 uncharacterized protein LOC112288690 isoform X1 [Physcomitrella patens]